MIGPGGGTAGRRYSAVRAAVGLVMGCGAWWVAWHPDRFGAMGAQTFFPLWLGYVLFVDGLTGWRTGTSLLARSGRRWMGLFLASAPAWWLFEYFNRFLGNWEYVGVSWSPAVRFLHSTISFATVVPAVFTTAEALRHVLPKDLGRQGPALPAGARPLAASMALGLVLAGGVVAAPRWFFPATWLCVFLIVDPVNCALGWPSLHEKLRRGDWRLALLLGASALLCGLFWEMWNYHSTPKWIYHVSLAPFGLAGSLAERHLFEMPLLGYGGYIPFGLEVYALYQLLAGLAGRASHGFLQFDGSERPPSGAPLTQD
jgi:hypothetical protein